MTKIKGIKKAILIFEDPEHGPRRVIFGEIGEPGEIEGLLTFFLENAGGVFKRLQALKKRNSKDPKTMKKAISETREQFSIEHEEDAGRDMEMELSYNVKKRK